MAQIQINVDTESKTVAVSINGTAIPDATDASVYAYRDSNGNVTGLDVSVYTRTVDDGGVMKRVSYYAEGSEKAKTAIASGEKVYKDMAGLVGIEETSQVATDIDEFISSQKRGF